MFGFLEAVGLFYQHILQLIMPKVRVETPWKMKIWKCSCRAGVENLFTITGRMDCAISLAGRKIN